MTVALPMVRDGYCSRCGECCQPDPTETVPSPLFTAHELADPERVEGYCPMFRWKDGRGFCSGHGWHPYYKAGCHGHPYGPQDLVLTPNCTFRFE